MTEQTAVAKRKGSTPPTAVEHLPDQTGMERILAEVPALAFEPLKITKEEKAILRRPLDGQNEVAILPTGIPYMPWWVVADRLEEAFEERPDMRPVGKPRLEEGKTVIQEYILLVRGKFGAYAVGGCDYRAGNPQTNFADAIEAARSNAIMRCGKALGVGRELWNPRKAAEWKKEFAEQGDCQKCNGKGKVQNKNCWPCGGSGKAWQVKGGEQEPLVGEPGDEATEPSAPKAPTEQDQKTLAIWRLAKAAAPDEHEGDDAIKKWFLNIAGSYGIEDLAQIRDMGEDDRRSLVEDLKNRANDKKGGAPKEDAEDTTESSEERGLFDGDGQ